MNPIQICNLALSWLGANRILSFDENSNESRLCSDVYEPLRQAVLEERAWKDVAMPKPYPKEFRDDTEMNVGGYPAYRRRRQFL